MHDKDSLLAQASIQGDKGHKESLKVTAKEFFGDGPKLPRMNRLMLRKSKFLTARIF